MKLFGDELHEITTLVLQKWFNFSRNIQLELIVVPASVFFFPFQMFWTNVIHIFSSGTFPGRMEGGNKLLHMLFWLREIIWRNSTFQSWNNLLLNKIRHWLTKNDCSPIFLYPRTSLGWLNVSQWPILETILPKHRLSLEQCHRRKSLLLHTHSWTVIQAAHH